MWLKQSPSKNNLVTASKKREAKGQFCELSPNMQRKLLKGETELGAHQCFQGQACCATETVSASRSDVDADYHCKLAGQCPCPSVPLSHADRPLHLPSPSLDPSSQFCFPASLCCQSRTTAALQAGWWGLLDVTVSCCWHHFQSPTYQNVVRNSILCYLGSHYGFEFFFDMVFTRCLLL